MKVQETDFITYVHQKLYQDAQDIGTTLYALFEDLNAAKAMAQSAVYMFFNYDYIQTQAFRHPHLPASHEFLAQLADVPSQIITVGMQDDARGIQEFQDAVLARVNQTKSKAPGSLPFGIYPVDAAVKMLNNTQAALSLRESLMKMQLTHKRIVDGEYVNTIRSVIIDGVRVRVSPMSVSSLLGSSIVLKSQVSAEQFLNMTQADRYLLGSLPETTSEPPPYFAFDDSSLRLIMSLIENCDVEFDAGENAFQLSNIKLKDVSARDIYTTLVTMSERFDLKDGVVLFKQLGINPQQLDADDNNILHLAVLQEESVSFIEDIINLYSVSDKLNNKEGQALLDLCVNSQSSQYQRRLGSLLISNHVFDYKPENREKVRQLVDNIIASKATITDDGDVCEFALELGVICINEDSASTQLLAPLPFRALSQGFSLLGSSSKDSTDFASDKGISDSSIDPRDAFSQLNSALQLLDVGVRWFRKWRLEKVDEKVGQASPMVGLVSQEECRERIGQLEKILDRHEQAILGGVHSSGYAFRKMSLEEFRVDCRELIGAYKASDNTLPARLEDLEGDIEYFVGQFTQYPINTTSSDIEQSATFHGEHRNILFAAPVDVFRTDNGTTAADWITAGQQWVPAQLNR